MFEKAAPESVGINSSRILNLISKLNENGLDMHSLLILKDDTLICEAYWAPFRRDTLHRMFSVTKSFVSLAIGILADKGRISLDDPIVKYFPEYEPHDGFHPYIKETTIRQMLTMTTPHKGTTFDKNSNGDWSETYFTKTPSHRPGTIFSYDTSASHVMAALVEKLTGQPLLEFLRMSGLREAGFSSEAYCITDGAGVSQGGSGMMARPLDILIAAKMVMSGGEAEGRQIVSASYIKQAVREQAPTFVKASFLEEAQGYGYQFWNIRDGYMMYGMAGQLAVCYPEKNLIIVTTADETDRKDGMQLIFNTLRDELYKYIGEENRYSEKDYTALKNTVKQLSVPPLKNCLTKEINAGFEFDPESNPMGLTGVRVITGNTGGKVIMDRGRERQTVRFGFGSLAEGEFTKYSCPYAASGMWADNSTLIVKANLIGECIGKVYIQLSFKNDAALTVFFRKTEGTLFSEYSGFGQSVDLRQ